MDQPLYNHVTIMTLHSWEFTFFCINASWYVGNIIIWIQLLNVRFFLKSKRTMPWTSLTCHWPRFSVQDLVVYSTALKSFRALRMSFILSFISITILLMVSSTLFPICITSLSSDGPMYSRLLDSRRTHIHVGWPLSRPKICFHWCVWRLHTRI